jgi:hypothetical protein
MPVQGLNETTAYMTDLLPSQSAMPVTPAGHKHRRRHHRRLIRRFKRYLKSSWRLIIIIVLTTVTVLGMSGLVLAMNARNQVEDSWQSLSRVLTTLNAHPDAGLTLADFERLQGSVRDLNASLTSARRQTLFLRPFRFLSADLTAYLESLDAAEELALAANDILTGMEPTVFFLTEGEETGGVTLQFSSGERVVELLALGRGRFLSADTHLQAAQAKIDQFDLADASPSLVETVDRLIKYYNQLQEDNSLLLDAPDLLDVALGLNETQTYLILSQNSDELRPSGGYISTYGWMTVRNGRILDYGYSPTTSTSPNPPDAALASEVSIPSWWARYINYHQPIYAAWDASWYADFPSTARMAAWFYDKGDNPNAPVSGVIGIDIVGFEYILEALGSVTVPEYNETISASNFREAIYQIRAEGTGDIPHKRFLAALYRQILTDWQNADPQQSADMRQVILRALREKHIMVYFTDDRLNQAADALGWSGAQEPAMNHDYLMVADANLGSKSNRSIARQLTYDVQIQPDGSLACRTAVSYDFPARVAEQDPAVRPENYTDINYHNLLQVFVPANSLLSGNDDSLPDIPTEVRTNANTEFVVLVQVDYNQTGRFQFLYTTPPLVESFGPYHRYRLLIQKQPGMLGELVSVQVTLPASAKIVSVSPEASATYSLGQPIIEFRVELVTDQWIEVVYMQ